MNASFRKPRDQDRSMRRTIESARSIIEPGNECAWQIERSLSQAITLEAESDDRRGIGQKYMPVCANRFSDEKFLYERAEFGARSLNCHPYGRSQTCFWLHK